jgi:hypothetical protein
MEIPVWSKLRNEDYLMRVLNKRYWPHHIKVADEVGEKEKWCYQNFKSSEWRNVGNYFAFKSEQDAMLFTLRWA